MAIPQYLNRGPVFRLLRKLDKAREVRRRRKWLRVQNRECNLADDLLLTGIETFPLEFLEFGHGVEIQRFSSIWFDPSAHRTPKLKIGRGGFIGQGCILSLSDDLTIGDHTLIGAYTYLLTNDHRFNRRDRLIMEQGYNKAPLLIGRDVWVGAHSVIRKGVTIGDGAIVGACSLVTKDIPGHEIWGGVPAKKISER